MMNSMYGIVLFLVASSVLTVSSNNDDEIFMVVDDPNEMSKAKPVEIGKFLLEDGKVFTLARKSSPSRNCVTLGEPCGAFDRCCDPFYCDGCEIVRDPAQRKTPLALPWERIPRLDSGVRIRICSGE
nr:hypothetical protein [Tanacetum cinerariifolium]